MIKISIINKLKGNKFIVYLIGGIIRVSILALVINIVQMYMNDEFMNCVLFLLLILVLLFLYMVYSNYFRY